MIPYKVGLNLFISRDHRRKGFGAVYRVHFIKRSIQIDRFLNKHGTPKGPDKDLALCSSSPATAAMQVADSAVDKPVP